MGKLIFRGGEVKIELLTLVFYLRGGEWGQHCFRRLIFLRQQPPSNPLLSSVEGCLTAMPLPINQSMLSSDCIRFCQMC